MNLNTTESLLIRKLVYLSNGCLSNLWKIPSLITRLMSGQCQWDITFHCSNDNDYFMVFYVCRSFGVLLWEIFSMAKMPYGGVRNRDMLPGLKKGLRLLRPRDCIAPMLVMIIPYSLETSRESVRDASMQNEVHAVEESKAKGRWASGGKRKDERGEAEGRGMEANGWGRRKVDN